MQSQSGSMNSSTKAGTQRIISLRTKLILGNMLIAFISLAAMGYYVYFRANESSSYLTTQLDKSVVDQAESSLNSRISGEAAANESFFLSMNNNILLAQSSIEKLYLQNSVLNTGSYWDAHSILYRLPNGSWSTPKPDPASVFIPANQNISDVMSRELNSVKYLDFFAPAILKNNPDAIALYFGMSNHATIYYPNIGLSNIVPPDFDITGRTWYIAAANENNPSHAAVWSDPYLDAAQNGFVITTSAPVYDPSGQFRGVVGMDIQLKKITDIVSRIKIGSTGYAILIDQNGNVLSIPSAGYSDFGADPGLLQSGNILNLKRITPGLPGFSNILNKMISGESGLEKIKVGELEKYIVYRPIPSIKSSLAIIVPVNELLSSAITAKEQLSLQTARTISFSIYLVLAILIVAIIASFAIGNMYTAPLRGLTQVAHEIANGNLDITADVKSQDEIGSLANAINTMTHTLRTLINSLEQRVAERTTKLQEHSDALEENTVKTLNRANQLQTVAQVGRAITTVQSLDELLPKISTVISTQFNYYHVGIFIQEQANEYTELKAASSEGGFRMLARGHKLKIGEMGIVGYVAGTGVARIALDTGADPVFFNNPDLPDTRSEIALPLKVGADIIGVLDVQSEKPSAFSSEEADILQILADQVSIAIQNSRRYQASQKSIADAQSIVRQYIRTEWQSVEEDEIIGYRFSKEGSNRIVKSFEPLTTQNSIFLSRNKETHISIPIILRDQTIGKLNLISRSGQAWDQDALDISKAVADHVAIAVENARLLENSQTRAARERTVSEITAKIGASVNMRNVLQTAVEELGRILPGSDVIIQLESGNSNASQKPIDLEHSA